MAFVFGAHPMEWNCRIAKIWDCTIQGYPYMGSIRHLVIFTSGLIGLDQTCFH